MPLCFAYGSNMDRDAMATRCPASKPLGPARLPRHRLVIMREGYASIVRDPRRTVWGMLWDLALADVRMLDRYEDVAGGLYTKAVLPVLTETGARRALVYVGRGSGPGVPRHGYMEAVLAAARSMNLPMPYLRELEALAPRQPTGTQELPGRSGAVGVTGTVRARRTSPLEPERNGSAGWSWDG